ncbi:MAG: hypothetical protein AAB448_03575 [Patescibacteria group bacterium]
MNERMGRIPESPKQDDEERIPTLPNENIAPITALDERRMKNMREMQENAVRAGGIDLAARKNAAQEQLSGAKGAARRALGLDQLKDEKKKAA